MEERRQLTASRDHLSVLLTEVTQQNGIFEAKLQRATEARTQSAMKIIEMESEIKDLKAALEKVVQQLI
ncbi:unnamed protein product [Gongylonema pulchrum]|uniref:RING-type E3 ubiquitin transferase n=1 Tax=Gongylonema pulchrum TaxID=637853 RepID=A0A183F0J3_9BILA|nr:unnamed protein product [Gongylonema pulchrum]VDN49397.1 unnamed protein product [Gongylonema pulchrum]